MLAVGGSLAARAGGGPVLSARDATTPRIADPMIDKAQNGPGACNPACLAPAPRGLQGLPAACALIIEAVPPAAHARSVMKRASVLLAACLLLASTLFL